MTKVLDIDPITVFEITGKDMHTFLNNQVVSELKGCDDTTLITAICNPKGRIIFTCILKINTDIILAAVDGSLSDNFLQYINMRRFRMDVIIKKTPLQLKIDSNEEKPLNMNHVIFTAQQDGNFNHEEFWLFMFELGLPWITAKTTELFIPQHVNLDKKEVISFDKGCYPGQEIVARLHFLGSIKKRMKTISYQSTKALSLKEVQQLTDIGAVTALCSPAISDDSNWLCQAIIKL